jgi:ketosteroid isomerase-like protein
MASLQGDGMDATFENLVERYWSTAVARDWDAFGQLVHEHVLYEVPQTRERVRGRAAYVEFNATYPGDWSLEIRHIVANDKQAVSKVDFNVDGETATGITFFEFRDGLIAHITDYWPAPYEPPIRMTDHIERY